MTGWYRMQRGWIDHELFAGDEFSRRDAWVWLIEHAAWKPGNRRSTKGELIPVQRGQIHASLRSLAEAWGWSKNKVARLLADLSAAQMVAHETGQAGTVITICNYDRYQGSEVESGTACGTDAGTRQGTAEGQPRDTIEEGKEYTHGAGARTREGKSYAYEGKIIRLGQADLDRWRQAYHAIPDISAELDSIDAWLTDGSDPGRGKSWFHKVPKMLNAKHQQLLFRGKATQGGGADVHFLNDAAERRMARWEAEQSKKGLFA